MKNVLNSAKSLGLKLNTASTTSPPSASGPAAMIPSVKSQLASLFQANDLVKCIVTSFSQSSDTCEVSLFSSNKSIKLVSEETRPLTTGNKRIQKAPTVFPKGPDDI